ncbi:MAG: zinc-ribbon and DUF3426 domain-containing protein [Pseudohongiellaceae bacterium]
MSFRVTQCPSCDSTFAISARLLESTTGRVRCGACVRIFNAKACLTDYGVDKDEEYAGESVFIGLPTGGREEEATEPQPVVGIADTPELDDVEITVTVADSSPAWTFDIQEADEVVDSETAEITDSAESGIADVDEVAGSNTKLQRWTMVPLLKDMDAPESLSKTALASLARLSAPLKFFRRDGRQSERWLFLGTLTVLLMATLAVQMLWENRYTLSQQARFRGLYDWGCQWYDCGLAPFTAIGAIRSGALMVRSHPDYENALSVQLVLRNTAPRPQPFPIIILTFNTVSGDVIALREFAPEEYLSEELRDILGARDTRNVRSTRNIRNAYNTRNTINMPVMTPVQIEMALIDPGPDAVNYTAAFRHQ